MESKINAGATPCYMIMLDIKRKNCLLNTIIYTLTNTEPLVYRVRKHQLGFSWVFSSSSSIKKCQKIMLSIYHRTAKENLLLSLHPTFVRVQWRWASSRSDNHPCHRQMCLEKACNACSSAEGWWWWFFYVKWANVQRNTVKCIWFKNAKVLILQNCELCLKVSCLTLIYQRYFCSKSTKGGDCYHPSLDLLYKATNSLNHKNWILRIFAENELILKFQKS